MPSPSLSLSVAAPAYNEADGIVEVVRGWHRYLVDAQAIDEFELVVCNDGSTDNTLALLQHLQGELPELVIADHPNNRGAAAATATAIAHTTKPWVLLLDSDGQFPIDNLAKMLQCVAGSDAVAVTGVRARKQDRGLARFGSWLSTVFANVCHGVWLQDFNCIFKLVKGDVIRGIRLEANGFNVSTEITSKVIERGYRWAQVPITHAERQHGASSMRVISDGAARLLFVFYCGVRQLCRRFGVLRVE